MDCPLLSRQASTAKMTERIAGQVEKQGSLGCDESGSCSKKSPSRITPVKLEIKQWTKKNCDNLCIKVGEI